MQTVASQQATEHLPSAPGSTPTHVFYTGPLDAFFGYSLGRLSYRTVTFERIPTDTADYQGNAVINYPDEGVPFTRIHEHKHFTPWETHEKTVAFREFSKETEPADTPYYPKRLAADLTLLRQYRTLAEPPPENPTSNIKHQASNIQRQLPRSPSHLSLHGYGTRYCRSSGLRGFLRRGHTLRPAPTRFSEWGRVGWGMVIDHGTVAAAVRRSTVSRPPPRN